MPVAPSHSIRYWSKYTLLEADFYQGALALQVGRLDTARRLLGDSLRQPAISRDEFVGYVLLLPAALRADAVPLLIDLLEEMPSDQTTDMSQLVLEEARRLAGTSPNPAAASGKAHP